VSHDDSFGTFLFLQSQNLSLLPVAGFLKREAGKPGTWEAHRLAVANLETNERSIWQVIMRIVAGVKK